jgi:hypothetical protein
MNTTSSRRDPFPGVVSLQNQVNRLFRRHGVTYRLGGSRNLGAGSGHIRN